MDKVPFSHCAANGVPAGVSFIGDSNHAISQFAAAGANMAILDGHDLAKCLCLCQSLDEALLAYDTNSMERALLSTKKGRFRVTLVHASGVSWMSYYYPLLLLGRIMDLWYAIVQHAEGMSRDSPR